MLFDEEDKLESLSANGKEEWNRVTGALEDISIADATCGSESAAAAIAVNREIEKE